MQPILDPRVFPKGYPKVTDGVVWQLGSYCFDDSVILNRSLWNHLGRVDLSILDQSNLLVVGSRYSGKTLVLLRCLKHFLERGLPVVVLDACVEEGDIALINILLAGGLPKTIVITSPPKADIADETELQALASSADSKSLNTLFPPLQLMDGSLSLLDVSYYGERSHEAIVEQDRFQLLSLYYQLIAQIIFKLRWLASRFERPIAVVMDEVRLPAEVAWAFKSFPSARLRLASATHDASSVAPATCLFDCHAYLTAPVYDEHNEVHAEVHIKYRGEDL